MSKRTAFFVTPIGDEKSEERKRANDILEHVLQPQFGRVFNIVRADLIDAPGNINHDIIERLYSSELVIADLTGFNPNVMYEVGVRHSFNKPIVQIAQSGIKLPFDVATERTIFFDIKDLSSVETAKDKLKKAVSEVMRGDKIYRSPVFGILNNAAVFEEGGDMVNALEDMSNRVDALSDSMWNVVNNGAAGYSASSFEGGEAYDMIAKIHDVITALPTWEAERLVEKLRKL